MTNPERQKLILIIAAVISAIILIIVAGQIYSCSTGTVDPWKHPWQKPNKTTTTVPSTTTTTIPPTTSTSTSTTTTSSSTTTLSSTTTTMLTTTTTIPGPTTSTTLVWNPDWWRPEWPNLSEGMVCNVVHFGANPADDGGDDGPAIQKAIDFSAGQIPIELALSPALPETWWIYYQFWTDVKEYQATGVWNPTYDYDGKGSNFF